MPCRQQDRIHRDLSTLAFPCFDGTYLPKEENEFVHTVLEELDSFQKKENRKSVLLFPVLSSRLRYLTHKTVENHPELVTFSVGAGLSRRVVVCYSELRSEYEEDSDTEVNNSLCEEPSWRRGTGGMQSQTTSNSSAPRPRRAPRKPDQPLYVPRASRERQALQSVPTPREKLSNTDCCNCCCCGPNDFSDSGSGSCSSDIAESTTTTNVSNCESLLPSTPYSVANGVDGSSSNGSLPFPRGDVRIKQDEIWDMPISYFIAMNLEEDEKDDMCGLSSSPTTADTSIDPNISTEEIIPYLKHVDVRFEQAHNDYSCFENVWINPDEFDHVIEIYDFPSTLTTDDLLDAFADYSECGMKIKWVDNTHALGVFSSKCAALHALSIQHPLLKARPLSKGSKKAKSKAIRRAEFIQPVKDRPRTDSTVARRMVTRALGLQRGGGRTRRF